VILDEYLINIAKSLLFQTIKLIWSIASCIYRFIQEIQDIEIMRDEKITIYNKKQKLKLFFI